MLDEAAKSHPNSWWWIKADGCDLVKGLGESMRSKWSGDVDLNDGALAKLRESYESRLHFIGTIGLNDRKEDSCMLEDIAISLTNCSEDISFLTQSKWFMIT